MPNEHSRGLTGYNRGSRIADAPPRAPRDLHAMLNQADRDWLKGIDAAMSPRPVVSPEKYCAQVDYGDRVTQQNFLLRVHRSRLVIYLRKERRGHRVWMLVSIELLALLVWRAVMGF